MPKALAAVLEATAVCLLAFISFPASAMALEDGKSSIESTLAIVSAVLIVVVLLFELCSSLPQDEFHEDRPDLSELEERG